MSQRCAVRPRVSETSSAGKSAACVRVSGAGSSSVRGRCDISHGCYHEPPSLLLYEARPGTGGSGRGAAPPPADVNKDAPLKLSGIKAFSGAESLAGAFLLNDEAAQMTLQLG